jgi:hypothetical protein
MQAKIFYVKGYRGDETKSADGPFDYQCKTQDWQKGNEDMQALDEVYRQFNRVDGTEEISVKGYEARSLSVGDIVYLIDHKAWYVCASSGWKKVPLKFVQPYLKTVTFKDSMMGLEWVLERYPELAKLIGKGAK